jgi:hypothetical protein
MGVYERMARMARKSTLVGRFIHVPGEKGGVEGFPKYVPLERQGYIKAQLTKEEKDKSALYEVAWFSWTTGEETQSTIVSIEAMHFEGWMFYSNEDEWRARADHDVEVKNFSYQEGREKKRRSRVK